jgi:hypothetical protein
MYGRGKFDLLRQRLLRVLYAAEAYSFARREPKLIRDYILDTADRLM